MPTNLAGLTDQQRRALATRDTSVAVSAGAGCGKTFVLTERFIAELAPQDRDRRPRLNQIAAITFTERAAREMRDRIRAACRRRLDECPDDQVDYWTDTIRELDSARISTIHSFCASLLRAHAVEARVDPRFGVLDGAAAGTLLFELTDEVFRDRLADRDETTLALVARFGLNKLRTMISRLLAVRQEIDWELWANETVDGLLGRWEQFWRRDTLPRLMRRLGESAAARTVYEIAVERPSDHPKMQERFAALATLVKPRPVDAQTVGVAVKRPPQQSGATTGRGFTEKLAAIHEAARVVGGGSKKNWTDEATYERFKNAAAALRKEVERMEQRAAFDTASARPAAETSLQAIRLAAEVAEQYERRKRELAVMDFNDLLIHARRLLVGPEREPLRKRLAGQLRLLLVDEFQDTDPLQVELVKALCDNEHLRGKLFLVGDYKQSIYRFRGADPRVFDGLRSEFSDAGRLPLSLNFRSQPAVLEFVNALFAEEFGEGYEPLRPARPQISPTPAVEFLWASDVPVGGDSNRRSVEESASGGASYSDDGPRQRLRRIEAEWIARRIRAMLDSGERIVWDEQSAEPATRAVRPGDVALLFRAMTNVDYYEDALQRYGIDYYLVGGRAFYAQQEIFDLLNLLRVLDSRCDEVSLAGALRSPLFSLHDETLFWLANSSPLPQAGEGPGVRAVGLTAGLFADILPDQLDADQRRRVEFAARTIRKLRDLKDRLPIWALIQEVLERTGYDALLVAEFLGERKLANLHKLIEQARSFDRSGIFTLSDFITQLAEFVARQPDEPLAATCPESVDVVKLMSIHQSKGLEFPVVVVPDMGRPRKNMGPPIAFTPQLGPAVKDPESTTGYDLYMDAENDEDAAEHSRLLYVAATRAADYLILASGVEQPGKAAGPWMEMLERRFDLLSGETRDVGGDKIAVGGDSCRRSASLDPFYKVAVTVEPPPITSKPTDLRQRRDLEKIVARATQMAADGQGRQPRLLTIPPIARPARRWFSFSRLNGKLHAGRGGINEDRLEETVATEPRLDPRGLGTLVHAVLAEVDFNRPEDAGAILQRFAPEHFPEEGIDLSEPIELVERFLRGPRAAELAAAKELYRELEFLLDWPSGECRIRGFIDCLYRDAADRWHLIDFKTGDEEPGQHAMQMLGYALAVEKIKGISVDELALCFLRTGAEHQFVWDAAARRRVCEMIDVELSAF